MAGAAIKGAAVGVPLAGIGGTGITYQMTKETVGHALQVKYEGYKWENIPDAVWTKTFNNFKSLSNLKDKEFKEIHTGATASTATKTNEDLKNLCKEKFNLNYKSIFSGGNEEFLEEVKNSCLIDIETAIGSSEYEKDKTKLDHELLKDYTKSDSDPELEEPLKSLKTKLGGNEGEEKEKAKEEHVKWCEMTASKQYLDDYDYRVAAKICKKKAAGG